MLRRASSSLVTSAASALMVSSSIRMCSTNAPAPKKQKKNAGGSGLGDVKMPSAESMPDGEKIVPEARQSTDDIKQQMDEMSKLPPEELERLLAKFTEKEEAESKVLAEDNLYQLDVSTKAQHQGAPKVFWKNVDVIPADAAFPGWYHVTVDNRKVKAFETTQNLVLPTKDYALSVAAEWGRQQKFVNKLSMPLTDLASGAQHVAPQMIAPRIDYLLSFFATDNLYFRSDAIQVKQDNLIDPISNWYSRVYDFEVPRVVGIGKAHVTPEVSKRVRDSLHAMNLNQYQIVSLCVMAQCTSSLMLPLALINRVTTIENALEINSAEEKHNISNEGMIEGFHDIRETDQIVKLIASLNGWRMSCDTPLAHCSRAILSQQTGKK